VPRPLKPLGAVAGWLAADLLDHTQRLIPDSVVYVRPRRGRLTVTFDRRAVAAIAGFLSG
jgi:hypothetical protein